VSTQAYLTRDQVAKRLGLAPKTLANWASEGKGPKFIRFGRKRGRVRYPAEEFEAWDKTHTET
jgi:predicted DNA-binding transcriptional regulator AlpA